MTWILSLCLGAGSWATCQRYIEYEYPTKELCNESRIQMKDAVGSGYALCHPKIKDKQ
jgi:hypothetical protein